MVYTFPCIPPMVLEKQTSENFLTGTPPKCKLKPASEICVIMHSIHTKSDLYIVVTVWQAYS